MAATRKKKAPAKMKRPAAPPNPEQRSAVLDQVRSRIVASESVDPKTLVANPLNWRTHGAAQSAVADQMLAGVGWVMPILANRRNRHVIDGHMRLERALRAGQTEIPVDWVEVTDEEEAFLISTLDPVSAMAETDAAALGQVIDQSAIASIVPDMGAVLGTLRGISTTPPPAVAAVVGQKKSPEITCPHCAHNFTYQQEEPK